MLLSVSTVKLFLNLKIDILFSIKSIPFSQKIQTIRLA